MDEEARWARWMEWVKIAIIAVIAFAIILLVRYLAKTLVDAMNPPLPQVEIGAPKEEVPVEVPEDIRRSNELLERVELMTQQQPINIAAIVREWLMEPSSGKK
jgi:flagellar biosynthesis/type III secretory pathway M-ring protein FliF/YscJ